MSRKTSGVCSLTGNVGPYVKSHILPRSLTPKDKSDGRLLQSDGVSYPKKQYDSWYDPRLVTRSGENILEKIDDIAYKELHNSKLIWRSWKDQSELNLIKISDQNKLVGYREISDLDQKAIGRFAASVLWRAGCSNILALRDFLVSAELLEQAREITVGRMDFDPALFPVRIFQYVTKGPLHNLTPMIHELQYPDGRRETFFRIFANGVFFHIVDIRQSLGFSLGEGRWYLGNNPVLAVLGLEFDGSTQEKLTTQIISRHANFKNKS